MADASKYFAVRRLVTSTTFIPVTAPIPCAQVVLENGDSSNAQMVRSDKTDTDTEKGLPASLELTLRASVQCWQPGDVVCWVAAGTGSGPVIVTFLR